MLSVEGEDSELDADVEADSVVVGSELWRAAVFSACRSLWVWKALTQTATASNRKSALKAILVLDFVVEWFRFYIEG